MLATFGERIYNEGIEKGRAEGIERGLERGIEKGRTEGIERGIEQGRIEVVKNMLANGFEIEQVARCTGFSPETVRRIND